jgi:HSP20 family protein
MSTLVKTHFSNPTYLNNLFNRELFGEMNVPTFSGTTPAVNVLEGKEGFKIELAAPGLQKSDFKLNLEKNQLTISAHIEEKNEEDTEKYTRKEFKYSSFQRTFTIPNTIDTEKIVANYEAGILSIALPKREEAIEKPAREIAVV